MSRLINALLRTLPSILKDASRLLMAVVLFASFAQASDDWVRLSEDGKKIRISTNDVPAIESGFSAVCTVNGKELRPKSNLLVGPVQHSVAETPFGEAEQSTATFGEKDSPVQLTLILKRLKSLRAFTLQAVFHNRSGGDATLQQFDLLNTAKGAGGSFAVKNAGDWLVTPLMDAIPAHSLAEAKSGFGEAAMIYNPDGKGLLIGPVGPAEATTNVLVKDGAVKAWVQMDGVLVRAGESRRSEEMIFCFEPSATATDIWTRWVAITHKARVNKGKVHGWCSWYDRTTKIDEAHISEIADILSKNPNVFGKGILQIDDGYQKMDGDWSANEKFPSGMAAIAQKIRGIGWTPGVWFAPLMMNPEHPWLKQHPDAMQSDAQGISTFMNANPFHPDGAKWINPSHPESKKFLFNVIKDARDRGFGYIKIDFNGIGSRFCDPTKTRLQIFRELYTLYRQAAGDETYILSCLGAPTRGVIGFVDAARVGPDSHPAHFDFCLKSVLRFQIFNNVWWHNDPDVSYLAQKLESRKVGYTLQGEGMWKTWHNINALVGGTAMTSEPLQAEDCRARWRNFEIMRPASAEPSRLLTLGHSEQNTTFGFDAARPYGNFSVYNFYNELKAKTAITLNFKQIGLPVDVECAVFDFWQNKVIATVKGSYRTAPLDQYSSELVRFTPLIGDAPLLVGSNLHLSMGATEIADIRTTPGSLDIKLTDAGAQDGSLTFFSKKTLSAKSSENCSVASVESIGENLWKVDITGRQWDKPHSVQLSVTQSSAP